VLNQVLVLFHMSACRAIAIAALLVASSTVSANVAPKVKVQWFGISW